MRCVRLDEYRHADADALNHGCHNAWPIACISSSCKREPTQGIPCAGSLLYSSLDRLAKHLTQQVCRNRQISRRIKKHLWLSNRSWARDVHSFGILHSWGALAGKNHYGFFAQVSNLILQSTKEKIYQIAAYKLPREQVKTIIFRYIFIYYNRVRIYTRNPLGLPPVKYREWVQAQQAA